MKGESHLIKYLFLTKFIKLGYQILIFNNVIFDVQFIINWCYTVFTLDSNIKYLPNQ